MADKLTIKEFADQIRQRVGPDSPIRSLDDETIVREALERRPEMINFLGERSQPRTEPVGSFWDRLGSRIKTDVDPTGAADVVSEAIREGKSFIREAHDRPHGGGLKEIFSGGGRLHEIPESLKKTYSDPANVVGDIISARMLSSVEGGSFVPGVDDVTLMKRLARAPEAPFTIPLQNRAGAGRGPVLDAEIRRADRLARRDAVRDVSQGEIDKSNVRKAAEHAARVEEIKQAHQQAEAKAQQEYQKAVQDFQNAEAGKKASHAKEVAEKRKEWVERTARTRQAQREQNAVTGQRDTMTTSMNEYGNRLKQNLDQTFQTVKSRLDSRWHKLRTTPINRNGRLTILSDETLNSQHIADTIETAKKKYLQGSPESLKQFNNLTNLMTAGEEETGILGDLEEAPLRPITWDQARTHYSALGDAMYSRSELPYNVRKAIEYVREYGLGLELRAAANKFGVMGEYDSLLNDYSQYEHDWKDMSSVTRAGGSPLAAARMAPNAATLIPQITGKTGDLLLEHMARYKDAGASTSTAQAIRKLNRDISNLPKIKVPPAPGKLVLPDEPVAGTPPEPPESKPLKLPPEPWIRKMRPVVPEPPVDPVSVRRQRIMQFISEPGAVVDLSKPASTIDLLARKALGNRFIREWVARYPRNEYPIPKDALSPIKAPPRPTTEQILDEMFGPGSKRNQ